MSRRTEIEAAIAAHNRDDREELLPPNAPRLLALMFPRGTVCRRSVPSLAAEGFDRRTLPRLLGSLVDAGFLSKEPGRRGTSACGKPTTGAVSTALERALARLGTLLAAKEGIEQGAGG